MSKCIFLYEKKSEYLAMAGIKTRGKDSPPSYTEEKTEHRSRASGLPLLFVQLYP